MVVDAEEREIAHQIRKADVGKALGLAHSRITLIPAKELSKAEQDLLRSMALTVEDNPWQRIQFTNKFNSLAPSYDPTALSVTSYQNNTLRQCIAAMIANIDGTGFTIERKDGGKIQQVVSPDSPEPPEPVEPPQSALGPVPLAPSPAMGPDGKPAAPPPIVPKPIIPWVVGEPDPNNSVPEPIMIDPPDVARIKAFFDEPYPGVSFMTMRKWLRENLETTGNAYIEIIRDQSGKLALLNMMDSKLTRLIRHDDNPIPVKKTVNRTGVPGDDQTVTLLVHERRFVQIIGLNARFFKVYGATRDINAQTGLWDDQAAQEIAPQDQGTEVLHFIVDRDVLTPYGIPRWVNQMPSVMGSRKAEELNLEFFESGGVPPVMILIQGGTLSAKARKDLTDYMAGQAKFKQRGVIMEIAPSGGDLNSAAQVKTTVEKFGDSGSSDSKFEAYDDKCTQRIRSAFRLPPLLIGLAQDYNYATSQTAYMVAEEQIFSDERRQFDEIINATIMKELDPDGTYVFKSKPMTAKFIDEQIKALTLAADKVDGKSFIDAINEIAGLHLKYDPDTDAQNRNAAAGAAAPTGPSGGGDESTGDGGGESTAGGGKSKAKPATSKSKPPTNKIGVSALKSATSMGNEYSTDGDVMFVKVTKTGKIRKLDHQILVNLATDWAQNLTGERTFIKKQVDEMHSLINMMTPTVRLLFAELVASNVTKATHDPNGVRELISCAGDVMARMKRAAK